MYLNLQDLPSKLVSNKESLSSLKKQINKMELMTHRLANLTKVECLKSWFKTLR